MTPAQVVRIVADDLTGALDAAAPFATPGRPVVLLMPGRAAPADAPLTLSTESRNLPERAARAATAAAFRQLAGADAGGPPVWLKKIDSVLRGHPFAETAQALATTGLARCIFAPAFPEMGRVTVGGRQIVTQPGGADPVVAADIMAMLSAAGLRAMQDSDPAHNDATVIVVNAATQGDLQAAVNRWCDVPGLLWCGSGGLALALAGAAKPLAAAAVAVVVIGTAHAATRAQVVAAADQLTGAPRTGPLRASAQHPLLIDPVPVCASARATRRALRAALMRLDARDLGGAGLFVAGGDTLSVVLAATGAQGLDCLGQVGPGLPQSRVRGGTLDGVALISKSGGFGDAGVIARLLNPAAA